MKSTKDKRLPSHCQTILQLLTMIMLILVYILITTTSAARILAVFPTPSISHQVVFRPLTQELAKRGHEVVVITPDPAFANGESPTNLTEINVHDISYKTWREEFFKLKIGKDLFSHAKVAFELFAKVFELQMKVKEVQQIINSGVRYDLLLLETCMRPTLALSHVFKAPVIQISSFGAMYGTYEAIGAPVHPLLYPSVINQRHYNLSLTEKVTELYNFFYVENLYKSYEIEEDELIKNIFGPDTPPLNKLYDNIDMVFLNVDAVWANNQPVPPNLIYIGGIHQRQSEELPKHLQLYLNSSQQDVIYVSFGTNVHSTQVPIDTVNAMVEVFGQLPYNVLWKWDDVQTEIPDNVKIYKWFPQMELLRHPKVKLFITQGGLQSTQEAIEAGVPLLGIPTVGDQWHNVEKCVYHRIGVKLEMNALTVESFKEAILSVIQNESYRRNIVKLRTIMHDQPQTPLERAIWWTEYVLRHGGGRHLRAPAANMSWTEYYELKLVGVLVSGLVVLCLIGFVTIKCIWQCIRMSVLRRVKIKTT